MAYMIPAFMSDEKRRETKASREGDVFDYLKMNLPENFIVVYEPRVISKRKFDSKPDFVIFGEKTGCVVLEVKNWNLDQDITKSDPYKQVQTHTYSVQEHLVRYPKSSYMITTGKNAGKLKFEVHPLVCMLGTEIKDKKNVATKFQWDESWFITEEELKNKDLLFNALKNVPKHFRGDLSFETLMAAAKTIVNTSTYEKIGDNEVEDIREKTKIDKYNKLNQILLNFAKKIVEEEVVDHTSQEFKEIEVLLKKIENDDFKIGMFGVIAAGKSTMLNALMGENFQRQGTGETSKVVTYIRKPNENNPEGSMEIEYKSAEEISKEIHMLLRGVLKYDDDDDDDKNKNEFVAEEWDIRKDSIREKIKKIMSERKLFLESKANKHLNSILKGYQLCKDWIHSEENIEEFPGKNVEKGSAKDIKSKIDENLEDTSGNESERTEAISSMIKKAVIYNNNRLTEKNIVLIDSPGVGSSFLRHTKVADEILKDVDMVVLVSKIDYKLGWDEKSFLNKYEEKVRRGGRAESIVFVLNQIGRIKKTETSIGKEINALKNKLVELGFDDPVIYPTDADYAKWGRIIKKRELSEDEKEDVKKELIEKPDDFIEKSRVPEFENYITENLFEIKVRGSLYNNYKELNHSLIKFEESINDRIKALDQKEEEIQQTLKMLEKNETMVSGGFSKSLIKWKDTIDSKLFKDIEAETENARAKIDDVYADLKVKNDQLNIKLTGQACKGMMDLQTGNYSQNTNDNISLEDVKTLINEATNESLWKIENIILDARKTYEKKYIEEREHFIKIEVPDLLNRYPEVVKHLSKKIVENEEKRINTDDYRINAALGFLDSFLINFRLAWEKVANRKDPEQAKKNIDDMTAKMHVISFGKSIDQKRSKKNLDKIKKAIIGWIEKDRDDFENQTNESVENYFELTKKEKNKELENLFLSKNERSKLKKKLENYEKRAKKMRSSPEMKELHLNIQALCDDENP